MKKILFCITGPSGSGKTTIMREVMNNELLSFTTRPMREGEVDGKDYMFITKEEFDMRFGAGELAEWTEYNGYYYGLTMEEINQKMSNKHAFFICDNHGFKQIKEKYDNVVSIFLYGDKKDVYENMVAQGRNKELIKNRLKLYDSEVTNKGQYDYVVKNNRGMKFVTEHIIRNIIYSEDINQELRRNEEE